MRVYDPIAQDIKSSSPRGTQNEGSPAGIAITVPFPGAAAKSSRTPRSGRYDHEVRCAAARTDRKEALSISAGRGWT